MTAHAAPTPQATPFRIAGIGRHGLIYGLGMLASKAVAFLMLPIYTRYLTVADYGVLQLVTATLEVVSIVAGARIAGGIFHFYHKAETEDARKTVLSTAFLLLVSTYVTATAVAAMLAPWLAGVVFGEAGPENILLLRVAAATLALEGLLIVPMAFIQLREKSGAYVGVQMGRMGAQLVMNLILLIPFGMGVLGVLIGTLTSNLIVGGILAVSLLRSVGLRIDRSVARAFLRFGVPLMGMQVAGFIIAMGDRYFLNRYSGEAAVGLYGLAYQFGYLLMYVGYIPFHQAWDPARFAIAKRPDRDAVYARVFVLANLMVVTCAVGIGLLGVDVIRVMATESFHPAATLVPVMMIVFTFHAWSYFHNLGMLVTERTELITVAHWAAAGVAILGYFLVIPPLGAMGAALVAAASYGTRFALLYLFSQRVWRVQYNWTPVVRVFGVGVLICAVGAALPKVALWWSVPMHLLLIAVFAVGVWVFGGFSQADRATVRLAFRSPREFIAAMKGA